MSAVFKSLPSEVYILKGNIGCATGCYLKQRRVSVTREAAALEGKSQGFKSRLSTFSAGRTQAALFLCLGFSFLVCAVLIRTPSTRGCPHCGALRHHTQVPASVKSTGKQNNDNRRKAAQFKAGWKDHAARDLETD